MRVDGLRVGVDLGGTSVKIGIAGAGGELLESYAYATESHLGPKHVVERIAAEVKRLVAKHRTTDETLCGIGLGVPGLVDIHHGVTKFLPNFPGQWRDVPVASWLGEHFQCPIRLLNDVRTATLGELRFGHGMHHPHLTLAFFALGTGVGGGIAIRGKLWLGPLGAAGELGHQTVVLGGSRCGCGNYGCLETVASGPAIAAQGIRLMRSGQAPALYSLVEGRADKVTTQEMSRAAAEDVAIRDAIIHAATYIGIAAANVVTILHPDMIVLGGGVAEIGELLSDTVESVIRDRVGMFPTDGVQVKRSQLSESAGVLGAIALASEAIE